MTFGESIREWRLRKMGLRQFARAVGVSATHGQGLLYTGGEFRRLI